MKFQAIAAATIDALYTALLGFEQCKHLLLHTHRLNSDGHEPKFLSVVQGGLDPAVRALSGHLTTQLTAGACLAMLCTEVRDIAWLVAV